MIEYADIKPLLFRLNPETAHTLAESAMRLGAAFPWMLNPLVKRNFVDDSILHQNLLGSLFRNPVGLAAGYDKNALATRAMPALGFGYTEVGTMTPKPQSGNPKPRLWRHIAEESLQNAMGFNNDGGYKVAKRLSQSHPFCIPIGANIGKNKVTPNLEAVQDYLHLYRAFRDISDYIVVNFSSPNTQDLRALQSGDFLQALIEKLGNTKTTPLLIKVAPDMEIGSCLRLCETAIDLGIDGIIATNTSIDYTLIQNPQETGGLSGACLKEKSFEFFKAIAQELHGKTLLISCGGIDSAEEAYRRIRHGASLIQVYTAIIYRGPALIGEINRGLCKLLENDGFSSIKEAVGADLAPR